MSSILGDAPSLRQEHLAPCPFCGEANELYPAYHGPGGAKPYAIDCLGCGIDVTPRAGMDVIAAWNRRAPAKPPAVSEDHGTARHTNPTPTHHQEPSGAGEIAEITDRLIAAKAYTDAITKARAKVGPVATQAQSAGHLLAEAIARLGALSTPPAPSLPGRDDHVPDLGNMIGAAPHQIAAYELVRKIGCMSHTQDEDFIFDDNADAYDVTNNLIGEAREIMSMPSTALSPAGQKETP